MTSPDVRVTTVVMTRDRWPDLRATLPRHRGPVIVVDNGSGDHTATFVRRHFPEMDVVALGTNLGAGARNVGVRRARTPYVAFADDDSWWAPGSLARAAQVLDAHPGVGLLAARILVGVDQRLDPVCVEMAASPLPQSANAAGPALLGFVACGAVVRREAFLAAGGFDDVVFFAGEEERLALDLATAGWELAYVDDVIAHHHPATAGRDSADRRSRTARTRLLTAVLRRPWRVVARTVADELTDAAGRHGLWAALPRLPAALSRRQPVPWPVEDARCLLDHDPARAPAAPDADRARHRTR